MKTRDSKSKAAHTLADFKWSDGKGATDTSNKAKLDGGTSH